MKRFYSILCLILLHLSHICAAQMDYSNLHNISLYSDAYQAHCFVQDRFGMMWIGTNKGLCRYDGYDVYSHYTNGADDNVPINTMQTDGGNGIYLGTESGLQHYNILTGSYNTISKIPRIIIRSILFDGECIWVGTVNGLYKYHPDSDQCDLMLENKDIYSLAKVRDKVFAGTSTELFSFSLSSKEYEQIHLQGISRTIFSSLVPDETDNVIWFVTNGLWKYHIYSGVLQKVYDGPSFAKTIIRDKDGNFVLGTDMGLYVINGKSMEMSYFRNDLYRYNSLSNNVVRSLYSDINGNVWIGTDYGVSMAGFKNPYEYTSIAQLSKLGERNLLFVMTKDAHNNLWLGGNNGVIRHSEEDVQWFTANNRDNHLRVAHNRIRDVFADSHKRLWITSDGGLQKFDYEKNTISSVLSSDSLRRMGMNWVYKIIEDREGNYWFSTYNRGVFKLDIDESLNIEVSKQFRRSAGLSGNFISTMCYNKTSNSIFALVNQAGVDKIDCSTYECSKIDIQTITNGRFPYQLISGDDEYIYIAFGEGVIKYNSLNGDHSLIAFPDNRELSIFCMLAVDNMIWISTNEGVWVLSSDAGIVSNFSIEQRSFLSMYYDSSEKKVYLGDADGYAVVSSKLSDNNLVCDLALSKVVVNGSELKVSDGKFARFEDRLVLEHDQNNIDIYLADLLYYNAGVNAITWSLGDKTHILNGGSNIISLYDLRPGVYDIKYKVPGISDKMLAQEKSFTVKIKHQKLFQNSIVLYTLLAILLLCAIIFYLVTRYRLRNERIDKENTLKLAEEKMQFYSDISHEFKTPLSLILAPVSKMLAENRNERDKRSLKLINDNALKMNQLIHTALEYGKEGTKADDVIMRSNVEIVGFMHTIISVFKDAQKGKTFEFQTSTDKQYCMLDVVKFESIMNNLLSNACKYTSDGDTIAVCLQISNDNSSILIKVSDTGEGIPQEDIPYIFHRYFQSSTNSAGKEGTGIGLCLVKKYVNLHKGEVFVESELGKGSCFSICMPLIPYSSDKPLSHNEASAEKSDLPCIAIIEDNEAISGFLCDLFQDDYYCVCANNGEDGLRICNELHPDLIITDIMMPQMDGMKMCESLRNNNSTSSIPIIVLTAVDDKRYELFSVKYRIDAFITKPFDSTFLLRRAKGLIEKKRELEKKIRIEVMTEPKSIDAISVDERLLSKMVDIIENNISDSEFNVNSLCNLMEMSQKQVYRKCTQLLNMTPVEYIRTVRLKKAALLLEQHDFNISEVMYMVGFSNHSYFSKCFSAEFGVTPMQYKSDHNRR